MCLVKFTFCLLGGNKRTDKFPFPLVLLPWVSLKKVPSWNQILGFRIQLRNFSPIPSTLGEYLPLKQLAELSNLNSNLNPGHGTVMPITR